MVKRTDQLQKKLISGVKSKVQRIIFRQIKTPIFFYPIKKISRGMI